MLKVGDLVCFKSSNKNALEKIKDETEVYRILSILETSCLIQSCTKPNNAPVGTMLKKLVPAEERLISYTKLCLFLDSRKKLLKKFVKVELDND